MDIQHRHNSTGDMYPRHRFELHYDQHSYRPNRPVNARLHQFSQTSSVPSSPQTRMVFPRTLPQTNNPHPELTQMSYGGSTSTGNDMTQGHSPHHSSVSLHRELSRSISMPMLQDVYYIREGRASQRHSRKNSLVSNCTHSSREASVSSELTMASEDGEKGDHSNCHRHHHRRGSVAIKFEEKKVVDAWAPTNTPEKGEEALRFNEGVFERHS